MTDLLGDQIPNSLPMNIQIASWDGLIGHTIKAVIDDPTGWVHCGALLITDLNCWMALSAQYDSGGLDSNAYLQVLGNGYTRGKLISDYASAQELFNAEAIPHSEFALLEAAELKTKKEYAITQAALLQAKAAQLLKDVA